MDDEKIITDDAEEAASDEPSRVLTVTQVNACIKNMLEYHPDMRSLFVSGEISNFKDQYRTGHLYFTLKDDGGVLRAVMFKGHASKLRFIPVNGMKVIAHGAVTLFGRDGQVMIYCDSLEPMGVGSLYFAFEQLKLKLGEEGLFREDRKRRLPRFPRRIGIITSPTGAAIQDMINITGRRFPCAEITLYPALVQGEGAVDSLVAGLDWFNSRPPENSCDVLIIGRGGGSMEDLWAFNSETLARRICASRIPVISAVGHESDFTIADFVADRRAPTPSAAAEIAVPDAGELKKRFESQRKYMETLLTQSVSLRRQRLLRASRSAAMTSAGRMVDDRRVLLMSLGGRLESSMKLVMSEKNAVYKNAAARLEALSPLAIIARGYSAVFDAEGKLVRSVYQLSPGDKLRLRLSDGDVGAEVTEIIQEK